jgi:hypothetical protein
MDTTKFILGLVILIVDLFLYRLRKSQLFINGIAKQDLSDAKYSKGKYWCVVISFLMGGIFLIVSSTHFFNF